LWLTRQEEVRGEKSSSARKGYHKEDFHNERRKYSDGENRMRYRIVCTNQEAVHYPTTHAHIVAVGTRTDPKKADTQWTLAQVIAARDRGDVFYTQGEQSGKIALVEKYVCSRCNRTYIRSARDAVYDNNLDNLGRCNWSS